MFFAAVRPFNTFNKTKEKSLRPGDCEVLLLTLEDFKDKSEIKQLPSVKSSLSESKCKSLIIDFIFQKTLKLGSSVGVKVKKVILAKVTKFHNPQNGNSCDLSFFVVPLSAKHDVIFNDSAINFYLLSSILSQAVTHEGICTRESLLALHGLDSWLKKQFLRPFGLRGLFRASPLDRIHENITNPAYATEPNRDWLLLENSLSPEQAMAKMKEKNQVDLFITNPLFGTDFYAYNKVDFLVVNSFFGQKPPDYLQIKIPNREIWFKGRDPAEENHELSWVDEFPVHRAAADGDVSALAQLIESDPGRVDMWDHEGWAPAHYACWYGRTEALKLLLSQGLCDPNICNKNSTSLLHLAAGCGHAPIVKLLADHPYIDRHALDRQRRSAMECCEQIRSKDWNKCMQLLKELAHKNYQKLSVHRMDGTEQLVELPHGSNSKVSDLINSLNFSYEARKYFTLWITSKSLHLQLKGEHSPLVEIDKWPNVLRKHGGIQPDLYRDEIPNIVLKRDVRLLPNVEEEVSDITSIHLLYEEAKAQVIRGLYPCSDQVAVAMAGVAMRILHGPYEPKKHKVSYFSEDMLRRLLPNCKLRLRSINWPAKLISEYKEISEQGPGEISQLQLLYLRYCWTQISSYGSAFFTGYAYATKKEGGEKYQRIVPLYIGINHRGIHFIKVENKALLVSVSYHSLTWNVDEENKLFHIRTRDDKINMIIHTPQSPLICALMDKLAQATSPLSH